MHRIEIGDEVQWQGHTRKVIKLLGLTVVPDGIADVICVPLGATRAEVFKDTEHTFRDQPSPGRGAG